MDWFLYDNGLRHERVKFRIKVSSKNPRKKSLSDMSDWALCAHLRQAYLGSYRTSKMERFAKIASNLQQYQSFFFNNVAGLRPATLLKKRLWLRCFPLNFAKFLRTPFYRTHLGNCF